MTNAGEQSLAKRSVSDPLPYTSAGTAAVRRVAEGAWQRVARYLLAGTAAGVRPGRAGHQAVTHRTPAGDCIAWHAGATARTPAAAGLPTYDGVSAITSANTVAAIAATAAETIISPYRMWLGRGPRMACLSRAERQ